MEKAEPSSPTLTPCHEVPVTPVHVDAKSLGLTPRSVNVAYNFRPQEVLKSRYNPELLKYACERTSTPRRKSCRPKSLHVQPPKFLVDDNEENIPPALIEQAETTFKRSSPGRSLEDKRVEYTENDAEKGVVLKNRVSEELPTSFADIEELHWTSRGPDLLQPFEERLSPILQCPAEFTDDTENETGSEQRLSSPYEAERARKEKNETVQEPSNSKGLAKKNSHTENDAVLHNDTMTPETNKSDTFATPCMATPSLNTTFTKDDTLYSDVEDNSNDRCGSRALLIPIIEEKISNMHICTDTNETNGTANKENTEALTAELKHEKKPEKKINKKVGFNVKEMISLTNPNEIKIFAQIQETLFPLEISSKKLNLLLSKDTPEAVNKNKTPLKSKIPQAVKTPASKNLPMRTSMFPPTSGRKVENHSQCKPRPGIPVPTKIRSSNFGLKQPSSNPVDRRYRRHTLSSAAKVKPNQLQMTVQETGSQLEVKKVVPFPSVTKTFIMKHTAVAKK